MLFSFLWVIPRRLNFICRRFGTLFHLHRQVGVKMEHCVPKRRHIKFRRRGNTQKKAYNMYAISKLILQPDCEIQFLMFFQWVTFFGWWLLTILKKNICIALKAVVMC